MKLLLALVLLLLALFAFFFLAPFGPHTETFVDIAPGTGSTAIASQLQRAGIIRSRYAFDLLRLKQGGSLKAGEYRFDHPASLPEVYRRIARGDVFTLTLSVPEGFNIFDIAAAVEAAGLGPRDTFLAAEHTESHLALPLLPPGTPRPDSLEGFLFPDTYHFNRHATPSQILTAMVHRFRTATAGLHLPPDPRRTLTLASIVEKEVRDPTERPLVAGVFRNRLDRSMPLQTDPTVIYAALRESRFRGTIYASDLQSSSPYNTYRHPGLPPGPICNPGLASLRAALNPAPTDFLYFVSDAAGHSRFAATLDEHTRNVQTYRNAQPH